MFLVQLGDGSYRCVDTYHSDGDITPRKLNKRSVRYARRFGMAGVIRNL